MERYLFWTILALLIIIGLLVATKTEVVNILDENGNIIGEAACYHGECRTCFYGSGRASAVYPRGMPNCD